MKNRLLLATGDTERDSCKMTVITIRCSDNICGTTRKKLFRLKHIFDWIRVTIHIRGAIIMADYREILRLNSLKYIATPNRLKRA